MLNLEDFSDSRLRGNCIHCGKFPKGNDFTQDHVPSKALLNRPLPDHAPKVDVCQECNNGFAKDEEYVAAFLASVLSGSTEPDPNRFPRAAKTLEHSQWLRKRIDNSRRIELTELGESEIVWIPEIDRVERVLVKNARGHVLFETGEAMTDPVLYVGFCPIHKMTPDQAFQFENPPQTDMWPECGSRSFQRAAMELSLRIANDDYVPDPWVTVQHGIYRYFVDEESTVRIVLHEYLAAEIAWNE